LILKGSENGPVVEPHKSDDSTLITLLTGRNAAFSGTRQLVFGLLAAGVTFLLGRVIGTAVGG